MQILGQVQGNCFMVMKHKGLDKKRFFHGSEITFQLANVWYTGTIDSLNRTSFFFQEVPIPIKEIQKVKNFRKSFNYTATGSMLIASGVFLLGIGEANYIINKEKNQISAGAIRLSSGSIFLGLIMLPFNSRIFKIGKENKLEIICL